MENIDLFSIKKIIKPKPNSKKLYTATIWLTKNNEKFLFKIPFNIYQAKTSILNEILISEICKKLDIPCQDVTLANYSLWNQKGALIKSFLKNNETEISVDKTQKDYIESKFNEILGDDFYEKHIYPNISKVMFYIAINKRKLDDTKVFKLYGIKKSLESNICYKINFLDYIYNNPNLHQFFKPNAIEAIKNNRVELNKLNNILKTNTTDKDILKFGETYAKKHNLSFDSQNEELLCGMAVFDYLFVQDDRNTTNISFIKSENNLKLAPMFDNGFSLSYLKKGSNFNSPAFLYRNTNIIMTNLTKSKIEDKNSLAFEYITKIKNFVENDFDNFKFEFLEKYPECIDFVPEDYLHLFNGENKKKIWLDSYLDNTKLSIQNKLKNIEQNNFETNENYNFFTNNCFQQEKQF